MFLYSERPIWNNSVLKISLTDRALSIGISKRKEKFSPQKISIIQGIRTFFFAPLKASLTVEAALVLPLFLFVMISVMRYTAVMETAVKFGAAMAETGKNMAVAAYLSHYGGNADEVTELAACALTAAYAHHQVVDRAGDTSAVKNANMALSSFLAEDEMIDLVMTYQIRSPVASVKLPGNFFIQRAQVRAWTGRIPETSGDGSTGESDGEGGQVYVTATGQVYHEDENCTHLKLSVREVSMQSLEVLRNGGGGIYHACESCGSNAGNSVYITNHGNRYHSSLSCSGLKRTVSQVPRSEAEHMRACSKCGKG